jgi:hypothetical protein
VWTGSAPPTSPRLLHLGYSLLILCLNGRRDIDAEQVDLGEPHQGTSIAVIKDVIKNKPLRRGEGVESKAGSIVPKAV